MNTAQLAMANQLVRATKHHQKMRTECVPHHLASRILTINGIQYTPASNNPSAVHDEMLSYCENTNNRWLHCVLWSQEQFRISPDCFSRCLQLQTCFQLGVPFHLYTSFLSLALFCSQETTRHWWGWCLGITFGWIGNERMNWCWRLEMLCQIVWNQNNTFSCCRFYVPSILKVLRQIYDIHIYVHISTESRHRITMYTPCLPVIKLTCPNQNRPYPKRKYIHSFMVHFPVVRINICIHITKGYITFTIVLTFATTTQTISNIPQNLQVLHHAFPWPATKQERKQR